tara:strand:- start:4127 stop:4306 length:180 start_codon:yes stop_codon:yes gene_type:complete
MNIEHYNQRTKTLLEMAEKKFNEDPEEACKDNSDTKSFIEAALNSMQVNLNLIKKEIGI